VVGWRSTTLEGSGRVYFVQLSIVNTIR
jgi:hypothetical protein